MSREFHRFVVQSAADMSDHVTDDVIVGGEKEASHGGDGDVRVMDGCEIRHGEPAAAAAAADTWSDDEQFDLCGRRHKPPNNDQRTSNLHTATGRGFTPA